MLNVKNGIQNGEWKWTTKAKYPFAGRITRAPIVYANSHFYLFGGFITSSADDSNKNRVRSSVIASFNVSKNKWTKLGELNKSKYGSGVAWTGSEFLVFEGNHGTSQRSETCVLNGSKITCSVFGDSKANSESLKPDFSLSTTFTFRRAWSSVPRFF